MLFVLLVGGFYGVLKATGAYDKLLDFLVDKASGRKKCTLITIIVLIALISSIAGLDLGFIVVFPLLIALLVKLGYDKFVALSATFGATIIGMYGATFASTLYGVNGMSLTELPKYSQIIPKVVLFVVGLAVLIAFVLLYDKRSGKKDVKLYAAKSNTKVKKASAKSVKASSKKSNASKKNMPSKKNKVVEVKEEKPAKKDKKEKVVKPKAYSSAIPAFIIFIILVLVLFLGTTAWDSIFKTNWFTTAHDAWTGVKIGGFDILNKLFGGANPLGTWMDLNRFQAYSLLLIIAMIALKFCYRTKWEEVFDGFVDGVKSFVLPAILTVLACSMFVLVYYNPFITEVTGNLLLKKFNVVTSGIYTMINSVFYVDYYYFSRTLLQAADGTISYLYSDIKTLAIIDVMFANLYSLVMLIAPTSVLLLVSLHMADVKFCDWFKFIWKMFLVLLIVSFAVFMFMIGSIVPAIVLTVIAIATFVLLIIF